MVFVYRGVHITVHPVNTFLCVSSVDFVLGSGCCIVTFEVYML